MANGSIPPTSTSLLASLASAADAARQAYLAALAANPGADLSALYKHEMNVNSQWSSAESKAFNADPAASQAQAALDAQTLLIRNELATIKNVSTWISFVASLLQLATSVAAFFS